MSFDIETILQLLAGVSLITFILSLFCIPWLVAILPRDYFCIPVLEKRRFWQRMRPLKIVIFFLRNSIGAILLLAGIAMLFLPGQGVITIVISIAVMSFPYKKHLMYRLTRLVYLQKSLDWLRKKSGKETFIW